MENPEWQALLKVKFVVRAETAELAREVINEQLELCLGPVEWSADLPERINDGNQ